jgi:hypothetical protein
MVLRPKLDHPQVHDVLQALRTAPVAADTRRQRQFEKHSHYGSSLLPPKVGSYHSENVFQIVIAAFHQLLEAPCAMLGGQRILASGPTWAVVRLLPLSCWDHDESS